jgi:sugar (pentulose or hexulose) kinase
VSRPVWNVYIACTFNEPTPRPASIKREDTLAGDKDTHPTLVPHGASRLPAVEVEAYNVELKTDDGFIGDRANKEAFRQFVDEWRKPLQELGHDPFGDAPSTELTKKKLDAVLTGGDPEAAAVVQGAIESFAQELSMVLQRFLKLKNWKETERIVIGGGFSGRRVGELAVGRASVLLKAEKIKTEITIIRNDPDEAGLLGAIQLAPPWIFKAHEAILAVDIGGTNIRAGIVHLNQKRAADFSKAKVGKFELWRHGDEKLSRDDAIQELIQMIQRLLRGAVKEGVNVAPFIGIGCPGTIESDGSIDRGAQNLPGNWESSRFNLPATLIEAIPEIGEFETTVVMHNDAVLQGLSEVPIMQDVEQWAVFTIGTGLGNALFTNRK